MALIQMNIIGLYMPQQYLFFKTPLCFLPFYSHLPICFFIAGNSKKVPESSTGKIVAIVVVTLGLPLFLIYLSVMGSGLAKGAKKVYAFICCCRRNSSTARSTSTSKRKYQGNNSKNNFGPTSAASMPTKSTILGSNVHIEIPPPHGKLKRGKKSDLVGQCIVCLKG